MDTGIAGLERYCRPEVFRSLHAIDGRADGSNPGRNAPYKRIDPGA
mgnify:FL=1